MSKLKAIHENIFVQAVDEPPSDVIQIIHDKKTYYKGIVVSVGDKVENVTEGEYVIIPVMAQNFKFKNDETDEEEKIYSVTEDQIYCKVV